MGRTEQSLCACETSTASTPKVRTMACQLDGSARKIIPLIVAVTATLIGVVIILLRGSDEISDVLVTTIVGGILSSLLGVLFTKILPGAKSDPDDDATRLEPQMSAKSEHNTVMMRRSYAAMAVVLAVVLVCVVLLLAPTSDPSSSSAGDVTATPTSAAPSMEEQCDNARRHSAERQLDGTVPADPSLPPAAGHWSLDFRDSYTDAAGQLLFKDMSNTHPVHANSPATVRPIPVGGGRNAVNLLFGTHGSVRTSQVLDTGPGQSFSVSAWVRLECTSPGLFSTAVAQDGFYMSEFYLQYSARSQSWAFTRASEVDRQSASAESPRSSFELRKWVHLVGVCDAAARQVRIFVNGKLEGQVADIDRRAGPIAGAQHDLTIGTAQFDGHEVDWFVGQIMDVSVYQQTLDEQQVRRLYKAA